MPVHAEEIIDRCLSMILQLPAFADVDVVHQVQRPKVVVDIHELFIGAAKPRDFFVELAIQFGGSGGKPQLVTLNDFPRGFDGNFGVIVHRPGNGRSFAVAGNRKRIVMDALLITRGGCRFSDIAGST